MDSPHSLDRGKRAIDESGERARPEYLAAQRAQLNPNTQLGVTGAHFSTHERLHRQLSTQFRAQPRSESAYWGCILHRLKRRHREVGVGVGLKTGYQRLRVQRRQVLTAGVALVLEG